jgi:hypothetical protein
VIAYWHNYSTMSTVFLNSFKAAKASPSKALEQKPGWEAGQPRMMEDPAISTVLGTAETLGGYNELSVRGTGSRIE